MSNGHDKTVYRSTRPELVALEAKWHAAAAAEYAWQQRRNIPSIQRLLGCEWGYAVTTPDDPVRCSERAERTIVVHEGPASITLKLCGAHVERLSQETTPRRETSSDAGFSET